MLFGHEDKIENFKRLIKENSLSHAYLFFGDNQIGKFTFAQSLGYFLETGEFEIGPKPLIDFLTILPDPEKDSIGIETVRQIRNFLFQKPLRSAKRTVVIDQAEKLTDEAQPALLKIVEEPPPDSLLILIAADPVVFLPALASRCQKIYFRRLSGQALEKILQEHYRLPALQAKKIAADSFGRLGRALNLIKGPPERLSFSRAGETQNIESFEFWLENNILNLRKDLKKNSKALAWLLERKLLVKRYNLNRNLQQRAAEAYLENKCPV